MANMQNKTKVITGVNSRFSYFHGWEPVSINGGAEKYSVSVLIPKDDKETINAIHAAVDAAIEKVSQSLVVRNQIKQPLNYRCVMVM